MENQGHILAYTLIALLALIMIPTFIYIIYKVVKFFIKDAINKYKSK